jgi:hypothetical protein
MNTGGREKNGTGEVALELFIMSLLHLVPWYGHFLFISNFPLSRLSNSRLRLMFSPLFLQKHNKENKI